jgi:hypothetical protein
MNPTTPPPIQPTQPTPAKSYRALNRRARNAGRVVGLLFAILAFGGGLGFIIAHNIKVQSTKTPTPEVKTLTSDELNKLSTLGANLGTSNQLLTIGATAQFNNNVIISKDLSLTGRLNANGPVTLKSLTISGNDTSIGGLSVGGDLGVTGATTLQKGATIGQLLSLTGNLAVAGTANFGTISASSITVRTLALSGPLAIAHLTTQGALPSSSNGPAIGSGGTTSISGNDTAGTVNMNTGSGSNGGIIMNITFRTPYTANVHISITPLTGAAASAPVYVTRTAAGFQIRIDSALPSGAFLSYDYFVIQ